MSEPVDFSVMIEQMRELKRQLIAAACFTPEEIAAMLGTFMIGSVQQHLAAEFPPEFFEMLTKHNRMSDIALSEMDDD